MTIYSGTVVAPLHSESENAVPMELAVEGNHPTHSAGAKEAENIVPPDFKIKQVRKRFRLNFSDKTARLASAVVQNCSFFEHLQLGMGMPLNDTKVNMLGKSIANLAFFNARLTCSVEHLWQELVKEVIKSINCTDDIVLLVFNKDRLCAASQHLVHISFLLHRSNRNTCLEFRSLLLRPLAALSKAHQLCWDAILSPNEIDEIAREDKFQNKYRARKFLQNFGADETQKRRADKDVDVGSVVQLLQKIQKNYTTGQLEFFLYTSLVTPQRTQQRYLSSPALGKLNCGDHFFWKSYVTDADLPTVPAALACSLPLLPALVPALAVPQPDVISTNVAAVCTVPVPGVVHGVILPAVAVASGSANTPPACSLPLLPALAPGLTVPESVVISTNVVAVCTVPVPEVVPEVILPAVAVALGSATTPPASATTISWETPDNDMLCVELFLSCVTRHERVQPNGFPLRLHRPAKLSLTLKGLQSVILQRSSLAFDVKENESHVVVLNHEFAEFSNAVEFFAFINAWELEVSTSGKIGSRAVKNVNDIRAIIAPGEHLSGMSTTAAPQSMDDSEYNFSGSGSGSYDLHEDLISVTSPSENKDNNEEESTKVSREQQLKPQQLLFDQRLQNYFSSCDCSSQFVDVHFLPNDNAVCSNDTTTGGWGLPVNEILIFVLPQDRSIDGKLKKCGLQHCTFLISKTESGLLSLTPDVCRCDFYVAQSRSDEKSDRSLCIHQSYVFSAFAKKGFKHLAGSKEIRFPMPSAVSVVVTSSSVGLGLVEKVFNCLLSQNKPDAGTGSVVGPYFFPQQPQIVEYSLVMGLCLTKEGVDPRFIRFTYYPNVDSCSITCNSGVCKHYIAERNRTPFAEIDGTKSDSFCSHLRCFRDLVGIEGITTVLAGIFHRMVAAQSEKRKGKLPKVPVFNKEDGSFTHPSATLTAILEQNVRGVDFETFMGHKPPSQHELCRLEQLDRTMALSPLDDKMFCFKIARYAAPDKNHIPFQLIPSSQGRCNCLKHNLWDSTPIPTGLTTRLYTESVVGIFDRFILKTMQAAATDNNCDCERTYCGVEDGIHLFTNETAFTITLLKSFSVNTLRFGAEMDFSAFCSHRTFIYQARHGSGVSFADEGTFLAAWFAVISTIGTFTESGGFRPLCYRNPCPECTANGGVQNAVALDGTRMITVAERNCPLGSGPVPPVGPPLHQLSVRWTRAPLFKAPASKLSTEFHNLRAAAQALTKSVKNGLLLTAPTKKYPDSTASLLVKFEALYSLTPHALPIELLSVLKLLTSEQLQGKQRIVLAKFVYESTLWHSITLWLPYLVVPALLSLINIAASDVSPLSVDENLKAEIKKNFYLLHTNCSLFAQLMEQFPRMPAVLVGYLQYMCARSKTVYELLSECPYPDVAVQEDGSYDPEKHMQALFFTAGPNSGDKLRLLRAYGKLDVEKGSYQCQKGHIPHPKKSFAFILSCCIGYPSIAGSHHVIYACCPFHCWVNGFSLLPNQEGCTDVHKILYEHFEEICLVMYDNVSNIQYNIYVYRILMF